MSDRCGIGPVRHYSCVGKEGHILPLAEKQQLVLHLYLSMEGNCEGSVYSDTEDGHGTWRLDHFSMTPQGGDRFQLIHHQ